MADPAVAVDPSTGLPVIDIYPPTAQPSQGPTDQSGLGGWDAIGQVATTPQPPAAAPATAVSAPAGAAAAPAAQGGDALGGWGAVGTANPQPAPPTTPAPDQTDAVSAAGEGAIDALTFGTAPAISGLSAASGMTYDEVPDDASVSSLGTLAKNVAKGVASPVVGAYRMATGNQDAIDAYNEARQAALDEQNAEQANHPYAFMGGELLGTGAMLPFTGGAGEAARALGGIAKGVRAGAIGGAAFGGGKAISEGGGVSDIAKGAAGGAVVGGVTGGVLGGAAETVGGVGRKVASVIRGRQNPEAEARRIVQGTFQGTSQRQKVLDRLADREAIQAGQEADTPVSIADYGGAPAHAAARAAANISPEAREVIGEYVQSRYAQQSQRFANWIRAKFGGADNELTREQLREIGRRALDPLYKRAYQLGEKGIVNKELLRLAGAPDVREAIHGAVRAMQNRGILEGFRVPRTVPIVYNNKGVASLRQTANGNTVLPSLAYWDHVARVMNGRIGELLRAGNKEAAMNAISLRNALLTELDKAVPAYKIARGGASKFFSAEDALEAGTNFVTDGGIDDRVAARAVASMSPVERALFARGFAGRLADLIDAKGDSSNVLNSIYLKSNRARRRITIALGPDGAAQFEALMRVEGMIDRFRRAAVGNSTTKQQFSDEGIMSGGAVAGTIEAFHGALNPAYLIAGAFIVGGRHVAREIDQQVALHVAQMLVSDDPAVLEKGYQIVTRQPVLMSALRYSSQLTARQLIAQLRPSGTAALGATIYHELRGSVDEPSGHPPPADDQYQQDTAGPGMQ